ncbi:hypothetical protein AB0E74_09115 [Streptomyces sp. NPDC030392]|uniref:hypothetical protein n=1 Tax=Streptomyces sp. NPDC030392 TaxID=3155468 RepID=UPI0033CD44BF
MPAEAHTPRGAAPSQGRTRSGQRIVYLRDRDDGQRMKDVVYVHPPRYKDAEFQNPAGLPRPVVGGLPFPWVTPMGPGGPLFREVERVKAELCRRFWGCQVCGNDLDVTAWVALERPGDGAGVITSAAMHQACLRLAVTYCPALGDVTRGYAFTEVYEDDVVGGEENAGNERAPRTRWYLRPVAETARPGRVRRFLTLDQIGEGAAERR